MAQTRVESCAMSALGSMELPGASYGSNSATPTGSANGTAVLRTRMAGGVGAGVSNGSRYPICFFRLTTPSASKVGLQLIIASI